MAGKHLEEESAGKCFGKNASGHGRLTTYKARLVAGQVTSGSAQTAVVLLYNCYTAAV